MDIPTELLHEILLKLPTKDVARWCCVSGLWCRTVRDPTFRGLHAEACHVAAPLLGRDVEALLVSQHQAPHGGCAEASVYRVSSSARPMCRVANPSGYRLANVCNGLLCFASCTDGEAPAVICNPVDGEKLALPMAPPVEAPDQSWRRPHFALGFSPSTKEYKLFRLSSSTTNQDSYVHVYTLGDDSTGWRQQPHILQHCPMYGMPPVLVDGKLCMVTNKPYQRDGWPNRILVMDVASETYRTYRLPIHREGDLPPVNVRVNAFELHGRLSVAVNILDWDQPELQVWLFPPWDRLQATKDDDDDNLYWDRRYSFRLDAPSSPGSDLFRRRRCSDNLKRAAWLDGDEMLCYRLGDHLYKYDTRRYMPASNFGFLPWNQKLQLWGAPSVSSNFYGGYRPTLLSPLVFALTAPSQVEEWKNEQELEENTAILCVPQCPKLKRHSSPVDRKDERATKRICCSIVDRPCRCYLSRLYKLY